MPYDYPGESLDIQARIRSFGLTSHNLGLIGGFVVAYGLFETTLERALWTLKEEDVKGLRPFTERMNTEAQFKLLAGGNPRLTDKCNMVLATAALAAEDLNDYRNSLVHGYLASFGAESTPWFMRNPAWHGVKRNKTVGDAPIDEPFQDLVLIAAWTLFRLVLRVEKCLEEPQAQQEIEAMKADVDRARSYARETRHLSAMKNHEKY